MNIKKQVTKGVKWTTISTVILAVVAILKVSILTRFLDKADFGLMALVTFVMGFMQLFNDMGLTSAILHKQDISKKEYASLYWINWIASFIMYGIMFSLTSFVADFYNEPLLNKLIPLLGLNLLLSGIGRQYKTIEQKFLFFKTISIIDIVAACFSLVLAVILAVKGFGVYALVYSSLLQFAFSNIVYFVIGYTKYGLMLHFNFSETRPFLKIGMYQVGGQVINFFNRDLDILLIGKFFSADALGGYSLAKQLVFRPAQLINPILTRVASPTLALFQRNKQELKNKYLKLINIVTSINIPVYVGLIIFAPLAVRVLYGTGFSDIVILVRVLSIYMIFRAIGNPIGSLIVATGRTELELIWNFVTLLILPVFIYIGSLFGLVWVTVSITLAMAALYIPSWRILVFNLTNASFKEYFKACFRLDYNFLNFLVK